MIFGIQMQPFDPFFHVFENRKALSVQPAGKLTKQSCPFKIESVIVGLFVSNYFKSVFFLTKTTICFTSTGSDILILSQMHGKK
jgi:hypothetical protein